MMGAQLIRPRLKPLIQERPYLTEGKRRSLRPSVMPRTRGDFMVEFIQTLKVPDGARVGQMFILLDFQINMIKAVYDPIQIINDGRQFPDQRIIREAVWTMGKKNGKTGLGASLLVGHLVGPEAVRNGRCYSAAFDIDQAGIIFQAASDMIGMDAELSFLLHCVDTHKTIKCPKFGTRYRSLTSESRTKHGMKPVFVIMDELAQFGADRQLYDSLKTSMGAQDECLFLSISTQAADDSAVFSQLVDYGRLVMKGEINDPSFHLTEFSVPNTETGIWKEEVWKKANPALGEFRSLVEMRQLAARARLLPSLERTFRNFYLNQRIGQGGGMVTEEVWESCSAPVKTYELDGMECDIALDLSGRIDLTAAVFVFRDEQSVYDIIPFFWTPQDTLQERTKRDRVPYYDWVEQGFMEMVPGSNIDYGFVAKRLAILFERFHVKTLTFDRWRMDVFKRYLEEVGIIPYDDTHPNGTVQFVPCGQGYKDISPGVEVTEELFLSKRIRHGNHPVLKWNFASATLVSDPAGNRKLDKAKSHGRIDGAVATVMALKTAELGIDTGKKKSVYETRGLISLR